jgi:hypothetical protein
MGWKIAVDDRVLEPISEALFVRPSGDPDFQLAVELLCTSHAARREEFATVGRTNKR